MTSFFRENWFWRGTQSAIFYYVSCAPLIDYKYKRRRRNEAARTEKERSEIVTTQPGRIRQPGAFQTNEGWVEEILTGPGPPKGWKTDPIVQKLSSREKDEIRKRGDQLDGPAERIPSNSKVDPILPVEEGYFVANPEGSLLHTESSNATKNENGRDFAYDEPTDPISDGNTISTWSSSGPSAQPISTRPRLSMERRLSSAVDNLRGTLRSTINLEGWNWKRYNREDEILSGFNQRVTRIWDKATNFSMMGLGDGEEKATGSRNRRRAATNESDRYDYQKYARNPEINELHPPVVSRLPTTRDDAAWMLLPPPSAAVMEGKTRPQDEPALRWPLARIGRSAREWEELKYQREMAEIRTIPESDMATESTPDLSDSLSEIHTSDDDLDWTPVEAKRHPAPIAGWVPIKRAASDFVYVAPRREI